MATWLMVMVMAMARALPSAPGAQVRGGGAGGADAAMQRRLAARRRSIRNMLHRLVRRCGIRRYGAVELGAAAAGKLALVHSAAGGVGLHALQVGAGGGGARAHKRNTRTRARSRADTAQPSTPQPHS